MTYEKVKAKLKRRGRPGDHQIPLLDKLPRQVPESTWAGMAAGLANTLVAYPFETLKDRVLVMVSRDTMLEWALSKLRLFAISVGPSLGLVRLLIFATSDATRNAARKSKKPGRVQILLSRCSCRSIAKLSMTRHKQADGILFHMKKPSPVPTEWVKVHCNTAATVTSPRMINVLAVGSTEQHFSQCCTTHSFTTV